MNREKHFHPLAALHLLRKTLLVYLLPLVQVLFDRNWDALRAALRQDLVLLFFISAVCWAVYYGGRWQVDAEGTVHVSWRRGVRLDRALRAEGDNVPVIILTAREEEEDKILGLEIGADDYITKPFSMRELMARVKANIRRTAMVSGAAAESGMSAGGALTINTDSFQVFKNGKPIELTQREYELLTFLASHPDKVFSRVDLMEQVWNYGYVGDDVRTVDVTVRRLREKIEDDPASPRYILTRRGVGYYYSTL